MYLGLEILAGFMGCICICKYISMGMCCCMDDFYEYKDKKEDNDINIDDSLTIILLTEDSIIDIEKKYNSECCSICLCEYEPNEHVSITPCNHTYHSNCLAEWVMTKTPPVCPLCQKPLSDTIITTPPSPYHQDDETRLYSDDGVFP